MSVRKKSSDIDGVRQELHKINLCLDVHTEKFEKIDQRFEKIDQRFEKIDQRFEKIDQRLDHQDSRFETEVRILHTSINKLAIDFYSKRIEDDQRFADLKAMFDTFMHRTNGVDQLHGLKDTVNDHERRLETLERIGG